MTRPLFAPVAAATLLFTLAACGSEDAPAGDQTTVPADTGTSVDAGSVTASEMDEADVEFAQGMIAHHEQAIEMAEIALDPAVGAGAAVTDLATRIRAAQDPEVELMTGWLTAAGEPVAMDTSDGHDMSSMEGMMTVEQMDALEAATGAEFDSMWLEMMIEHHAGAIAQSESVKADSSNPDVLALADQIIATQQAEIAEMEALLAG